MTKYLYLTAINQWLLVVAATLTNCHPQAGSMRGVLSRYIGPGPGEKEGDHESLKSPMSLTTEFFFLFLLVFSTVFSLFRKIMM